MEGLQKTIMCIVAVCLLISTGIPIVSSSNDSINKDVEEENHPAFYNVTIIRSYGFTREKIVKQVSYEDAMQIKNDFELINTESDDIYQKTMQKGEILRNHKILNEFSLFPNLKGELIKNKFNISPLSQINKYNQSFDIFSIFGLFAGQFYGVTINLFNFITIGLPLYIRSSHGADLMAAFIILFGLQSLKTDLPVTYLSMMFMGVICLIPFISPIGGYIEGFCINGGAFAHE